MGARFGLFCYAQGPDEGYADFDWFSTEDTFSEDMFYPETFEGFSADMLTAEQLAIAAEETEVMVGNVAPLTLTATFRDGHAENVAPQARFTVDSPGIVDLRNGQIRGLKEGRVQVTADYTDPMGHHLQAAFTVRSTFFPFAAEYINTSLFAQGTYTESTRTFKPGQWGQMGWEYPAGADMSDYKYLVVKLKRASNCDAHLNIFTANSIWSDCCESAAFGTKKQIVVNLQTARYTSGNKKGQPLDTKHIHIVDFWGNGNGTIVVDDVYLTNNADYTPPSAVDDMLAEPQPSSVAVYTLSGQLVRRAANRRAALESLPTGLYIVGGRKVSVK